MSTRLKEQKHFLLFLLEAPPSQFSLVVKHLTADQTLVLKEIVTNLLGGNIDIDNNLIVQLRKFKHLLRSIQRKSQFVVKQTLSKNPTKLKHLLGFLKQSIIHLYNE